MDLTLQKCVRNLPSKLCFYSILIHYITNRYVYTVTTAENVILGGRMQWHLKNEW